MSEADIILNNLHEAILEYRHVQQFSLLNKLEKSQLDLDIAQQDAEDYLRDKDVSSYQHNQRSTTVRKTG